MTEKRTDFLWIVQTIMINYREKMVGWSAVAGDAIAASYRIPQSMTARDAAREFCACMIEGFNGPEKAEAPSWMSPLRDPT